MPVVSDHASTNTPRWWWHPTMKLHPSPRRCFVLWMSFLCCLAFLYSFCQTAVFHPLLPTIRKEQSELQQRSQQSSSVSRNHTSSIGVGTGEAVLTDRHESRRSQNVEQTTTTPFSLDAAIEKIESDGGDPPGDDDDEKDPLHFVICTRIRNEAPYLKEWIEYHRMIGFESFYLMNNDSTDQTQCILDAYIKRGIVVSMNHVKQEHLVFDACAKRMIQERNETDLQNTWMATHDVDEFIWFKHEDDTDSNRSFSLQKVVHKLKERHASMESMFIPRFLFGSSGHDYYQPGLVIDHYTHRFDPIGCPSHADNNNDAQSPHQQRRQLKIIFGDNGKPESFCNPGRNVTVAYHGEGKGMSLVPSLALDCLNSPKKWQGKRRECQGTHFHKLQNVSDDGTVSPLFVPGQDWERNPTTLGDARYVGDAEIVNDVAIMHYMTRSREEFYQRTCASRWIDKYQRCGDECTPETFFNLSEMYSNNFEDARMAPFAKRLQILEKSKDAVDVSQCETAPHEHKPWHFYRKCWRRKKRKGAKL